MQDAKMQHQMKLEHLFNKNQLIPRIRDEFALCKEFDFIEYIESKNIPAKFGIDVLVQMALHKRTTLDVLVGTLRHHCDTAQEVADLLFQCALADLLDWSPDLQVFVVKFTLSADVQEELDRFQYPLPMVVPPREVTNNKENGYLTSAGSIILRQNHHDNDVCLDHINRMNKIRLTINPVVVKLVRNKWRNLDKPKAGETRADYEKRRRAFEKYDRTARDVIGLLQEEGDEFYLTHKYDKRGRTYCQGYHVSYQGAAWNKAVIEFANKEMVE